MKTKNNNIKYQSNQPVQTQQDPQTLSKYIHMSK